MKEKISESNEVHHESLAEGSRCPVDVPIDWSHAPDQAESWGASCLDAQKSEARETRRPSFKEIYMRLAELMAGRSTCKRLKVGTVITSIDFRKVLAVGYNGNASSLPNTCDTEEPGACGCLHSEENAIINCDAPRSQPKYVFVTHLPCPMCAKRIINLGNVVRVFYRHEYRNQKALELLGRVQPMAIPIEKI